MHVIHIITGLADGGAEGVLYRLVTNDFANTHHVVSLTDEGKYGEQLREAGVRVTALKMPRGRISLLCLIQLWRILRSDTPDTIQTWMYHADLLGGVVGRLARVPVIWGIRNSTLISGKSSRATIWVARMCATLSGWVPDRIIVCAEAAVQVHIAIGYDGRRMVTIPNGYDLSRFSPDERVRIKVRAEWGICDDIPVLGMVARFDPQKDHACLIEALATLLARGLTFKAVFVGSRLTANNLELLALLDGAGLSDHVLLFGPRSDVPAIMRALDIHVLSSAYGEAFPNVLAEAMACGTPCVATDVGDAADILGDTGWLVPSGNPTALADAIESALSEWAHKGSWPNRQQHCRQKICDEYALASMVARYRDVWSEVGARSPSPRNQT